ncbi:unnamed protein product [Arabidopsis arenosa]|uniref:Uncharacterized protein n=1 Tax=Arabidopsis arenosa TaxID=38785 RepID=A0A8S2ACG9_ARAAE|nr:unnamed protein product [Arabidopsis arenosa]
MRPGQMKMFLDLALRCCEERSEDRPKMIDAAKELKRIERSLVDRPAGPRSTFRSFLFLEENWKPLCQEIDYLFNGIDGEEAEAESEIWVFQKNCFVSEGAIYKSFKGIIEDNSYLIKRFHEEHGVLNQRGCITVNGEESILPWSVRPPYEYGRSDGDIKHIAVCVKGLYENRKLDEVIDPMMAKDITNGQRLQVEACVVLALRCCEERDEDRPKMIQVAKELKRIERMEPSLDAKSGLLKPEMLEDGSSMVKWTKKFGIKIEIMLILSLCIAGCLIALLFGVKLRFNWELSEESVYFTGPDGYRVGILAYVKGLSENGKLSEVICPMMMQDMTSAQRLQVEACVLLALRCCEERVEDRPKMIQVAKELKRIEHHVLRS